METFNVSLTRDEIELLVSALGIACQECLVDEDEADTLAIRLDQLLIGKK
jgi:hypothetical protein